MTSAPWHLLEEELNAWADSGRTVRLWWRDDDAVAPSPALDRLLAVSTDHAAPVTLAVIPAQADVTLVRRLDACPTASVAPHGLTHANHAAPEDGEGASEFPASRPIGERLADVAEGWGRMQALFGDRPLPMLVAPFNRVGADLLAGLPMVGLTALSVHGPRAAWRRPDGSAPPVTVLNTHVDLLRWRPQATFIGADSAIRRLVTALAARRQRPDAQADLHDPAEPLGLLTHHRVHGDDLWGFLDEALTRLKHPAVRWSRAADLLAAEVGS